MERLGDGPGDPVDVEHESSLCLVTGMVMPVVSASWKASEPIAQLGTWPVMATSGTESM